LAFGAPASVVRKWDGTSHFRIGVIEGRGEGARGRGEIRGEGKGESAKVSPLSPLP
jgi:hypothetical protein